MKITNGNYMPKFEKLNTLLHGMIDLVVPSVRTISRVVCSPSGVCSALEVDAIIIS